MPVVVRFEVIVVSLLITPHPESPVSRGISPPLGVIVFDLSFDLGGILFSLEDNEFMVEVVLELFCPSAPITAPVIKLLF